MRRIFWAMIGIGIGAVVGMAVVRWGNRTKARMSPGSVASSAGSALDRWKDRAAAALVEGVEEMTRREAEIRAELGLPQR